MQLGQWTRWWTSTSLLPAGATTPPGSTGSCSTRSWTAGCARASGCRRPASSPGSCRCPATRSRSPTTGSAAEGYLTGRVGAGTYVCSGDGRPVARPAPRRPAGPRRTLWRARARPNCPDCGARWRSRLARAGVPGTRSLAERDGRARRRPRRTTSRSACPTSACSRTRRGGASSPASCAQSAIGLGDYGDSAGPRRACGRRSPVTSGCPGRCAPAPDDVVVTQGAQQALDLIGRVLIEPGHLRGGGGAGLSRRPGTCSGRRAPGSSASRSTARAWSWRRCRASARLVYVTPSHQFPLGTADVAGPADRAAGLGRAPRRGHHRGRLRQRVPLLRPPAGAVAEHRPRRPGHLRRARSPRRCCRCCGWVSWSRRRRCGRRCARPSSSPTGTATSRPRRRWPGSSTRACWPGTSGGPPGPTPSAMR